MEPEMDLVMAIHKLRAESAHDIAFFHFKGHANRDCPVAKLRKEEQMNVLCDTTANTCVDAPITPTEFTPVTGSRAII